MTKLFLYFLSLCLSFYLGYKTGYSFNMDRIRVAQISYLLGCIKGPYTIWQSSYLEDKAEICEDSLNNIDIEKFIRTLDEQRNKYN